MRYKSGFRADSQYHTITFHLNNFFSL